MKNRLSQFNIKNIKDSINKYGYEYRTRDIILQFLAIMVCIITVGVISRLEMKYIMILILLGIILTPIVILSIFKSVHSVKRFAILSDYLSNIIPIFLQKSKIRYTLSELYEISSYEMKDAIEKAIEYIDNTKNDVDLFRNSLKIIEDKFNNSRLVSVHKLLIDVENNNSVNFKDIANDMSIDIENWIKRTYSFQKELKSRKTKLLILCLLILFMNSIFIALYDNNAYFIGFTANSFYQISTTFFISIIMIIATIILIKLNGNWLIEDIDRDYEKFVKDKYDVYTNGKTNKLFYILMSSLFLIATVFLYMKGNLFSAIVCLALSVITFINKDSRKKKSFKVLNKALLYEFPRWLRDVCLKVNDMTVVNAIESTINDVSYPLKLEINRLLNQVKKDPTSIKPYNEFLSSYKLDDACSSMKVLYSINNVSKSETRNRVSNLIVRNQELLATVEKIENDDEIVGVEAIAYIPTLFFCMQMVVSMFLMFSYMMQNIQGAVLL